MNPSRGNSRYTYEDVGNERYFQQLRAKFNGLCDLKDGVEFLHLVPHSPQRLGTVVDAYNGKDLSLTSGIIVRRVGCPSFGCGFRNEIEWLPRVLTANGLFGVGTYGVVATKLQYRYLEDHDERDRDIGEACFIGEMWITLANRNLAQIYLEALNDNMYVNENTMPITAEWAGYMLSGKDLPKKGELCVHRARVDKAIWEYPDQFNGDGEFLTNGPGMPSVHSSFTI